MVYNYYSRCSSEVVLLSADCVSVSVWSLALIFEIWLNGPTVIMYTCIYDAVGRGVCVGAWNITIGLPQHTCTQWQTNHVASPRLLIYTGPVPVLCVFHLPPLTVKSLMYGTCYLEAAAFHTVCTVHVKTNNHVTTSTARLASALSFVLSYCSAATYVTPLIHLAIMSQKRRK